MEKRPNKIKIAVALKQVPDFAGQLVLANPPSHLERSNLDFLVNEADESALEAAFELARQFENWEEGALTKVERGAPQTAEIVALSAGPRRVTDVLRKALALGAHKAVQLRTVEDLQPLQPPVDSSSVATRLASFCRTEAVDILITGSQSSDSGTAATASMAAELLGWPHVWLALDVELRSVAGPEGQMESDRTLLRVRRELEAGREERVELGLPCVLQFQVGSYAPRLPTVRGLMKAKKETIEEFGVSPTETSAEGSLFAEGSGADFEEFELMRPTAQGECELLRGEPDQIAHQLLERLRDEAKVL